ncbi:hypothetical protein [Nonomuraea sp. NPDC049646]|uniref:hypothetical protein n=1 Tax=unclassified Nonomuraea TaxID=2593643 RepID=UPI0037AC7834
MTYEVRQRYYLARVPAFEIDTTRMEDFEKTSITGHRRWTSHELAVLTTEVRYAAGGWVAA